MPALALAAALLAACGGVSGGGGGTGGSTSCDTIRKIESYRYSVTLKLQAPASQPDPQSGTGSPTAAPLSDLADALTALFSDFTLEGAYIAPSRAQAILRFQNEELELRSIGDRRWLRIGNTWQEEEEATDLKLFTPEVVCERIVASIVGSLRKPQSEGETVNDVVVDYYRLDETDLTALPELLGTDLPQHYSLDLWLAQEGRWPVQLRIQSSDVDEMGRPVGFVLTMDVRDVGDPGISIEPPVVVAAGPGG